MERQRARQSQRQPPASPRAAPGARSSKSASPKRRKCLWYRQGSSPRAKSSGSAHETEDGREVSQTKTQPSSAWSANRPLFVLLLFAHLRFLIRFSVCLLARATGLTVDSLMAQHRAELQALHAPAAAAAASSSSSAASSSSSAAAAAAASVAPPLPKARTALSHATEAVDSFEQRILQRQQSRLQAQIQAQTQAESSNDLAFSNPAIDFCSSSASSFTSLSSAPSASSFSSSSSSSSSSCSLLAPPIARAKPRARLSTTCDPAAAHETAAAMTDAPGGLRIFKRRDSSAGVPAPAPAPAPSPAQKLGGGSGAEEQEEEEEEEEENDENEAPSGGNAGSGGGMSSLWNRVAKFTSSYFAHALTPNKQQQQQQQQQSQGMVTAPGGPPIKTAAGDALAVPNFYKI